MQTKKIKIKNKKIIISIAIIILLSIVFGSLNPAYLTVRNWISLYREACLVGFLAVGMAFILGCDEIDLSCGTIVYLMVTIAGRLLEETTLPLVVIMLIIVLLSILLEVLNYTIVYYLHVSSFITTLAMSKVYDGLRFYLSFKANGYPTTVVFKRMDIKILETKFGLVYLSIIIFILVVVFSQIIMKKTKYGNYVYALGSNKKAAVLAGVDECRVKYITFAVMGALVGISSLFTTAKLGATILSSAGGMEFLAISAVIIGGANIMVYGATGGVSDAVGAFVGITFMYVLKNGLMKINIPNSYIGMIQGACLLLIMCSDLLLKMAGRKMKERSAAMKTDRE